MTLTIQTAIDRIVAAVPGAPFADTVDTLKIGDASQAVTRIVTCFLATAEVIEQSARLGANFIITHEPTFYNHRDETHWLAGHEVYLAKRRLIEQNHLVIWRFHDYLHSLRPDSTEMGMLHDLGWTAYVAPGQPRLCRIPPMTLRQVAQHVKDKFGLATVRIVGDLEATCRTVSIMPGAPGGEMQIGALGDADALIAGEIDEWETSEYVRDAVHLGHKKGLIVTGHAASEEPGMRWVIPWLQERLPGVAIDFIPTGGAFRNF